MKKNIIITVLAVLLLGLGVYVVTDKVLNKEVKEEKKEEVVEKEESITLEEAEELLDKFGFNEYLSCDSRIYDYQYSDNFKSYIALKNVSKTKVTEKACSDIYSEDKLNTGYKISQSFNENVYVGEYGVCTNGENTYVISYEDANKVYKEMYGTEMPKKGFTTVNFGGQFYHFYDYIEELDSFVALKCGACGGSCGEPEDKSYELKTATLTGNELVIVVNYDNSEYEILFTKNNNNYIFKSFGKK